MAKELVAFKTKIYPTKTQKQYFQKCFGIRRFAWNFAVENWDTIRSWERLDKVWNNSGFLFTDKPYLYEVNSMIKQMTFKSISETWKMFFKNPSKYGKPRFKSKKKDTNRFSMFEKCARTQKTKTIMFSGKWINLNTTRALGRINFKAAESLEFLSGQRIAEWTISERAGDYYISIIYERTNHEEVEHIHPLSKIGIDAGMKTMITSFNGDSFSESNLPNRILNLEKKLNRLNRSISRKTYKSYRWNIQNDIRNKLYLRIANIKADFLNKLANYIAKTYKVVNYESYGFNGALSFTKGAKKLYRLSPYTLQSKLEYKCKVYNTKFNLITGEPTTQTCSSCGHRYIKAEKLTLRDRVFNCCKCGLQVGRDENSAINIYNLV